LCAAIADLNEAVRAGGFECHIVVRGNKDVTGDIRRYAVLDISDLDC